MVGLVISEGLIRLAGGLPESGLPASYASTADLDEPMEALSLPPDVIAATCASLPRDSSSASSTDGTQ